MDWGNPGAIGGVPPSEGVGVDTRLNCHGAGDALLMIVWLLRMGGEDVGDVLLRCRQSTSKTSFSSALPSKCGDDFIAMSILMRSAWSSSKMSLSASGAVSRAVPRPEDTIHSFPTLKDDQALSK